MEDQKPELNEEQLKAVDGGIAGDPITRFSGLPFHTGTGLTIGEISGNIESKLTPGDDTAM